MNYLPPSIAALVRGMLTTTTDEVIRSEITAIVERAFVEGHDSGYERGSADARAATRAVIEEFGRSMPTEPVDVDGLVVDTTVGMGDDTTAIVKTHAGVPTTAEYIDRVAAARKPSPTPVDTSPEASMSAYAELTGWKPGDPDVPS